MPNTIRTATIPDVVEMVELVEQHRLLLQEYQPIFWRKAELSREVQIPYFEKLLSDEEVIKQVAEGVEGIEGFLIAAQVPVPPVYNPNGKTYLIDDFCVKDVDKWNTVGAALLESTVKEIKARGGGQVVVVCPHLFEEKRALLRGQGLSIASEWYVGQL